ncbi:hypothetical protein BZG36_05070 [Bifiguratus adelaidae]|uniref:Peptidase M20 dimerisation domain-containing protein n=1 Tax=Bifiguratus adelaidae TaxID=1938954 RepID=A0A261XVA8_9FUNG|nr:hypothetical protein BZG36_05070 [Bifiguratus adelaidae]
MDIARSWQGRECWSKSGEERQRIGCHDFGIQRNWSLATTAPDDKIHGIITHSGTAVNVIPDYSSGKFAVRTTKTEQLEALKNRLITVFGGAAGATGYEVKFVGMDCALTAARGHASAGLALLQEKKLFGSVMAEFKAT